MTIYDMKAIVGHGEGSMVNSRKIERSYCGLVNFLTADSSAVRKRNILWCNFGANWKNKEDK